MVASSKVESLNERFVPYVEELRELFQSRHLAHGQPSDVDGLAQRLAEPQFREEMVSMVRSMQYREEEQLSRADLMDILTFACGGPHVAEQESSDGAVRQIIAFVTELLHAPSYISETILPAVEAPFEVAPAAEAPTAQAQLPPRADRSRLVAPELPPAATPAPDALASGTTPPPPAWSTPEARYPARTMPLGLLGRAYWLPGLLALLLVSAVVWTLHHRTSMAGGGDAIRGTQATKAPASEASASPARQRHGSTPQTVPAASAAPILAARKPRPDVPAKGPLATPATSAGVPRTRPSARAAHPVTVPRPAPSDFEPREGVFLASSGVMASHLLFAPAPAYPKLARFAHVEGQVIVQVVISRRGSVAATRVLEGPLLLRGGAEHAIRKWRYRPYVVDGRPTDVAAIVTVSYRLPR